MAPVHIIPLPSSKNKSVMKQHTALGQLPYDKLEETLESARLKLFEKRDLAERTKQLIFLHIIGFRRVTDLRGGDVERIFRLKKDPDQYHYWHLTEDDRRCVPQSLGPILREYEIVEGRDSMAMFDEALIRTRLEAILSAVLATKKREELLQLRKRSAKFTVFQNAHWKFQHILKKRCRHNGHRFILTGMVDYSLWYEEWRIAENTKLIVVISRMDGDMVSRRQALAYMAMIQQTQKESGKEMTPVFGIATDGLSWWFIRLGSDALYTMHPVEWDSGEGAIQVISHLYRIIDQAVYSASSVSSERNEAS